MFFTFFESPFWRGTLWIGSFLSLYAVFGYQFTVITALAVIAMRQKEGKALFF
jgi:hypothetical protein|tara:strand:+ start:336 stop:494 length:159 start_codon:yes stop_codon:yes gene_type:complete